MARNQQNQDQKDQAEAKKFKPGVFIADGLAEAVEYAVEEFGPLGIKFTGMQFLLDGLRAVGAANPLVIHGLDAVLKNVVVAFTHSHPAGREFLTEIIDAYLDKVKLLSKNADPKMVQLAKGDGLTKVQAKIKELQQKHYAKKTFAQIVFKLGGEDKAAGDKLRKELGSMTAWMHNPDQEMPNGADTDALKKEFLERKRHYYERWLKFKSMITDAVHLEYALTVEDSEVRKDPTGTYNLTPMERNVSARLEALELLYGTAPTIIETVGAMLKGEQTPQTKALEAKMAKLSAEVDVTLAEQGAEIKRLKAFYVDRPRPTGFWKRLRDIVLG
jgi:hypothetical protein